MRKLGTFLGGVRCRFALGALLVEHPGGGRAWQQRHGPTGARAST